MAISRRHEIGVGCLVVVAAVLLGWMSLKVGALQGFGETIQVTARFPDAAGLTEGAAVRVAGVQIGRVTTMSVEHDTAVVGLELDQAAGIREDAVVSVRARSVLGEKYVEVAPRSEDARLLEDGDVLTDTVGQTEIDELVGAMGPLVAAVDPQALSNVVGALSRAFEEDPERARRMLEDLEALVHNARMASEEAPALVSEGRATLATVRRTAEDARPVIERADRVVGHLEDATRGLPETAQEVDALVKDARGAVAETRVVVAKADRSTAELEDLLSRLGGIDKNEIRRLLREEGILIRLREKKVKEDGK